MKKEYRGKFGNFVHEERKKEEETLEILKGLRPYYEQHHGVAIEDSALEAAVKMSVRYINAVSYTHLTLPTILRV